MSSRRLGAYHTTWQVGLHVKIPIIDRIASVVSLKEDFLDFKPQPVVTKDNVTIMIDTVIFYYITDPSSIPMAFRTLKWPSPI